MSGAVGSVTLGRPPLVQDRPGAAMDGDGPRGGRGLGRLGVRRVRQDHERDRGDGADGDDDVDGAAETMRHAHGPGSGIGRQRWRAGSDAAGQVQRCNRRT